MTLPLENFDNSQQIPKCYSYIRYSTMSQMNGDSLRRQSDLAEKWARDNGHVLDDSLRLQDLGVSGYSGANRTPESALGSFLEQIKQGRIVQGSVLLVENLDRLTREKILDAFTLISSIIRAGVRIVTLADGMIYDIESINQNPMQLMVSLVILTRGHEESETKSKRLKEAWAAKRSNLDNNKLTSRCPAWLRLSSDKKSFEVIDERAQIIKRIFEMKREGIGVMTIAQVLNRESPWLPQGRPLKKKTSGQIISKNHLPGWRESYIQKILRFRAVLGEFQPRVRSKTSLGKKETRPEGTPIPDYFPRVIEDELFFAVQDHLKQNQTKGGRNGRVSNLFGHIAKCGYCGASLAYIDKGPLPKGGTFLLCDYARRGAGCVRHPIRYPEFESLMLEYCQGLDVRDVLQDTQEIDTEVRQVQDRLAGALGKLKDLETKAANLTDTIASTADKRVRERIEKALSANLDEQEALNLEIKELSLCAKKLSSITALTSEQLRDIKTAIVGESSPTNRAKLRAKLRKLIDRIIVYPAGIKRRVFQDMIKHLEPSKSQLVKAKLDAGDYDNREQRTYIMRFLTGNWRKIEPNRAAVLSAEYDDTTGTTYNISWEDDGELKVELNFDISSNLDPDLDEEPDYRAVIAKRVRQRTPETVLDKFRRESKRHS